MMLANPQMEAVFDFSAGRVNTLVIENPAFFRTFLRDIDQQIRGCSGMAVLSKNDVPIDFSRNAEIIDSFLNFEINRRNLLTKLLARMEAEALNEANYVRTASLLGELENYLTELSFDLPCDIVCSKINIGSILKAAGIEIPDDYDNDLERLLDYMELSRELDRDKLFIIVNLRSYYCSEDISAFLESVLNHDFRVLLVDSVSGEKLPNESRITVDNDLCEF